MNQPKLKIAIQKSGRLFDDSIALLRKCNIHIDNRKDQLKAKASNFPIEVLYLRNSDIPNYVESGVADLGIVGENLLVESGRKVETIMSLGFSKCRLSIAGKKEIPFSGPEELNGKTIATSYPTTLQQYLDANKISAQIHTISGSVEIAPNIGLSDYICDLVSSGSTLFKNGLEEKIILLKSQACLIQQSNLSPEKEQIKQKLLFRIEATLKAIQNKYILMNAPNSKIGEIIELLPGMKSPTVMPLAVEGWSSVHTVIQEEEFWDILAKLKDHGAEGILVIPIEKMIS
jgi:ATP phosphoribosyltransferase